MSALSLLTDLRARGVAVEALGDRVRFRPTGLVTESDRAAIREHKAALLAMLAGDPVTAQPVSIGSRVFVVDQLRRPDQRPLTVREIRVSAYDTDLWVRLSDGWWRPMRILRPVGKDSDPTP